MLVRNTMVRYYEQVYGEGHQIDEVTMADLEMFFNNYQWHMDEDDKNNFLHEVKFLTNMDSKINL
jgi:hypothetical protein